MLLDLWETILRALITRLKEDGTREKVLVDDWPKPSDPTGNQVRVRTLFSGVTNGTERNDLIAGNYSTPDNQLPSPLGYQNVGEITHVGPDVMRLNIGDIIYSGVWLISDHLEYVVLSEDELLVRLPESVNPRHAALLGIASVAVHNCRATEISTGDSVLIVGQGCVGQVTAQIAHSKGCKVDVCDINLQRLQMAKDIDCADNIFNTSGTGWSHHIRDGAYDTVLDLAGVPGMENDLLTAARRNGQVAFIAGRNQVCYDFNLGQAKEIAIKQLSHFDTADLTNACTLIESYTIRIGPLLKDVVPVQDAERIYRTLRDTPDSLMGVVFEW